MNRAKVTLEVVLEGDMTPKELAAELGRAIRLDAETPDFLERYVQGVAVVKVERLA